MHRRLLVASVAVLLSAVGCGSPKTAEGHAPGCDSCHGFPPATGSAGSAIAAHVTAPGGTWQATDCNLCHPTSVNTVGDEVPVSVGGTHVNGSVEAAASHAMPFQAEHAAVAVLGISGCRTCHGPTLAGTGFAPSCNDCHAGANFADWQTNCTFCHGTQKQGYVAADLPTAAPPEDVGGAGLITDVTVGVHRTHTQNTTVTTRLDCSACHAATPTDIFSPGHIDAAPAEVPFGAVARAGGRSPAWDRNAATCTNTACHSRGGLLPTPNWTVASGASCSSCHVSANRADPFHTRALTANTAPLTCDACHGVGFGTGANHVNGVVEIPGVTCVACHGNSAGTATAASPREAAPPVDVHGNAASAQVGAHAAHLDVGTYSNGVACTACHPNVGTYALTHADGVADVLGGTALSAGTWAAGACNNTYCHGSLQGGTQPAPVWTDTSVACDACHGLAPTTGQHQFSDHVSAGCAICHPGYTSSTVDKALHLNGVKNVASFFRTSDRTCGGCHNPGEKTW